MYNYFFIMVLFFLYSGLKISLLGGLIISYINSLFPFLQI